MDITPQSRIGEIAARHPLATRVFARHRIDFCCGGGVPLERACARRGLPAEQVVAEIEAVLSGPAETGTDWLTAPLERVVGHIVETYHRPLRDELPRLEAMAEKVARVHAERDPEGRLPRILDTVVALRHELERHMAQEEEVLFPAIVGGGGGAGDAPIGAFVDDHAAAGEALGRLRDLTDGYVPPEDACNTWRALWAGLADLETAMHQHIHLENNVLFPRAETAAMAC
jgi:regulator of cell morphogenesis and NO signaling